MGTPCKVGMTNLTFRVGYLSITIEIMHHLMLSNSTHGFLAECLLVALYVALLF